MTWVTERSATVRHYRKRNVITSWETDMDSGIRELTIDETGAVSGGMKYDHNYVSKDVIDARGGYLTVWGVTMTFDINGKCSSISPA
ncbi:MAG: hypothetical protein ACTHN2_19005 [Nitrobacter sp.]